MRFLAFEEKLLNKLITESMSQKEQAKLKFGFYIIADTIKKGILVYSVALILGILLESLTAHLSFLFIRQVTYGWHSSTNLGCKIESILLFNIIPYIISKVTIHSLAIYSITFIVFSAIYLLGPIGTQLNTLNKEKKSKLKFNLLFRILILSLSACIIPIELFQYIMLGATIQFITLLIQFMKNGGM